MTVKNNVSIIEYCSVLTRSNQVSESQMCFYVGPRGSTKIFLFYIKKNGLGYFLKIIWGIN